MAAGEIRAGKAFVEIFTKDSGLTKGLNRAQAKLKAFGSSVSSFGKWVGGIGALVTAPLIAAAKASADSGAAIYDMSKRTGIAVEALSAMQYAADRTGSSLDEVEVSIKRMQKSISGAKDEMEGTTGSLAHLGLAAKDIKGFAPEEQFAIIAEKIRAIKDPTERVAAALKVFGRAGTSLIPLIDRYDELTDRAKKLGLIRSTASAKSAKEFADAMYDATRASKSLWSALGSAVIPILKQKTELVMRLTLILRDWTKKNAGLTASVFKVAFAMTIAGTSIYVLGKAIALTSTALTGLKYALTGLGVVVGILSTPVYLVTAALAAGAVAWAVYTESGKSALAALVNVANVSFGGIGSMVKQMWADVSSDTKAALSSMSDALANGNIAAAAGVLWAFLRLEWVRGINVLSGLWEGWKASMVKVGYGAFIGVLSAWEIARNALANSWIKLSQFFGDVWDNLRDSFAQGWDTTIDYVAKAILRAKAFFDKSFDYEAAAKLIDQQANTNRAARNDQNKSDRDARGKAAQDRLAGEDKRFGAAMADLGKRFNDVADAATANAEATKKEKAASKDLADAQDKFKKSLVEASKPTIAQQIEAMGFAARDAAERLRGLYPTKTIPDSASESGAGRFRGIAADARAKRAAAARDEAGNAASDATKSRGTFSAYEAAGIARDKSKDETNRKLDEANKQRGKMLDLLGRYLSAANSWG